MAKVGVGRGTFMGRHRHGVVSHVPTSSSGGPAIGGLALLLENGQGILLETGHNLLLEEAPARIGYSLLLENGEALNTERPAPLLLEL